MSKGFDKKYLISLNYGKESSQIRESKIGKEEHNDEESRRAQEGPKPRERA